MTVRELATRWRRYAEPVLAVLTVGALAAGAIAWVAGYRMVADGCWIAGTVIALAPAVLWVLAENTARTSSG